MKLSWIVSFLAILLGLVSGTAQAEQPCEQLIVDSQQYIKDVSLVTEAAKALGDQGAEVRLRVIDRFSGSPNLDVYVEKMRKSRCPSWQQANGDLRSNFIVMYVATGERGVGLYMGGQWERELKQVWPGILGAMKPKLAGGLENHDLSLAFATGLRSLTNTIEAANQPSQVSKPVVIQTEPTDYSGLWTVLLMLVIGSFVIVIGFVAVRFISAYRQREHDRREMQQKTLIVRGQCTNLLNRLRDILPIMEARTRTVGEGFDGETVSSWTKRVADISSAVRRQSEANASIRGNPDESNLSVADYKALYYVYKDLKKKLEEVESDADAFTNELQEAERLRQDISKIFTQSLEAFNEAKAVISDVEKDGFLVADISLELTNQVEPLLTEAEELMGAKLLRAVIDRCREVVSGAHRVAETARKLPETKRNLEEQIRRETERTVVVQEEIESGYQVFFELESNFAPVCIESIVGNGTEAQKHLAEASKKITAAEVSWEAQEWLEAKGLLDEIKGHLDEASSLMHSITERTRHLHIARDEASGEIQAAQADIARGRKYLTLHDEDTDDAHFSTLDQAERLVVEAEELLRVFQPDYLRVVRLAASANSMADVVLKKARNERERAERKRRQAHALLREAASSMSAAKEFIEDHRSDVGSTARGLLEKAEAEFASAGQYHQRGNVEAVIKVAGEADRNADSALDKAKRDFHDAERKREEERARKRRARQRAAESSSYSSGSRSRSSWGSGGSSFGGSSSFGGGGSSFGGSSNF